MKILMLLMSGALLGLVSTSAYLSIELGNERERSRQLADQLDTLRARTEKLEGKRQALASAAATAEPVARAGSTPSPNAAATGASGSAAQPQSTYTSPRDRMLRESSSRALMRAAKIATRQSRDSELAQVLGMTNADYRAFLEFLADRELQRETSCV